MAHTKQAVNVLDGIPKIIKGVTNVLFVGSGDWASDMQREYPGQVFRTLAEAIAAVPVGDGTNTFGFYNTKIIVKGTHEFTSTVQIPLTKSGIEIIGVGPHWGSAGFYANTDFGAGVPMIEVGGFNIAMRNIRFWSEVDQAGDALTVGVAANSGALYFKAENVSIMGPNSASYKTFVHGIRLKDAKFAHLKDVYVDVGTGATAGILCESGYGNGREQILENVHVNVQIDTGDAVIPLKVNADQHYGRIIGGSYIAQSTADAIEINANGWALSGGGIAANENVVSADATPIDNNGTGTIYGEYYVKQIGGSTAAVLASNA